MRVPLIVVRRLLSLAAKMERIARYQALVDAATLSIDSDPRDVGRWLLGLAILLDESSQHAPAIVELARPWANALADEGAILGATRARVAHQMRILAAESLHVHGFEHRRDFFARVRELMAATRDPSSSAHWIALGAHDTERIAPPRVPAAAPRVVIAAVKIVVASAEPAADGASQAELRAAS